MAMVIRHDETMYNTYSALKKHSSAFDKYFSQVITGTKIKNPSDDASGYSISERMRVQLYGLSHDKINLQNGNALLAVAAEGINNVVEELRSLKELAVMAANDTNGDRDHMSIQKELEARKGTIDLIANNTNYNGITLLDGTYSQKLSDDGVANGRPLIVHHGTESGQNIWLFLESMRTEDLKEKILDAEGNFKNAKDIEDLKALNSSLEKQDELKKILQQADGLSVNEISLADNLNSRVAMRVIEGALDMALNDSTTIGAYQHRMEYSLSNVLTMEENVQSAESRIRDTDMAMAMMGFAKNRMLVEASTTLLSQANHDASDVIGLLQ